MERFLRNTWTIHFCSKLILNRYKSQGRIRESEEKEEEE
jgi:hypothetical protein